MSENWSAIAAEVADALAEVGFVATLSRTTGGPATPWDTATPTVQTWPLTVVDDGIRTTYARDPAGSLIPRTARVLTVAATGEAPRMGDVIVLADGEHEITQVAPLAPGGEVLLFDVSIAI